MSCCCCFFRGEVDPCSLKIEKKKDNWVKWKWNQFSDWRKYVKNIYNIIQIKPQMRSFWILRVIYSAKWKCLDCFFSFLFYFDFDFFLGRPCHVNIMLSVNLSNTDKQLEFSIDFWDIRYRVLLALIKSMRSSPHRHNIVKKIHNWINTSFFISKTKIYPSRWYICYNHGIQFNLTDTFLKPLKTFQLAAAHSEAEN